MSEQTQVTPEGIIQLGLGFWGSKTLLSAVELGLFSVLAGRPAGGRGAARRASSSTSAAPRDFFDALVALGHARARRTAATPTRPPPTCSSTAPSPPTSGGILEMADARLYPFWGSI